MCKDLHQREQRGQTHFMIFTRNTFFQVVEIQRAPAALDHFARHRHLDAQELIPFPILTRPGLEKTGKTVDLRRVGVREHL